MAAKRRIFSGLQPSGAVHLGNYLGAIRNWVALQEPDPGTGERPECLYCVVDYHAITAAYEPGELRRRSLEAAMDFMACGVGGERTVLFLQSQAPEHAELAWILSCVAAYGDLTRMTQFKDKAAEQAAATAGLFTYPVLMAADILLYKATHVPVGEDQLQHLELAREIARRFNQRFGDTFPEPQPLLTKASRVMSLADPSRKMSKSAGEKHYVGLFEDEASIRRKVRAAVTETGGAPGEPGPGVRGLLDLLEAAAGPESAAPFWQAQREGRLKYSELKDAVAERLLSFLAPLRRRRAAITEEQALEALRAGARRARELAAPILEEVRSKIGLLKV